MVRVFVTGPAGVGKTTLVERVAREVERWGYIVGGMITKEVRRNGKRIGFKIIALDTGEEGTLASLRGTSHLPGVPFGKYVVHVDELERVGVSAIRRALVEADLVVIDEIGPMEYKSNEFVKAVGEVLNSDKRLLAVVHRKMADKFRPLGRLHTLSVENRNREFGIILDEIMRELRG
ncbi:NTPase [Thermococcus gammatolerans]|uniref:Nucleoside-triphosphatase TGAM_1555 n=1 Tax=Thermococcus gammatolerans (strain DSM 15229 / JCM 11827 / EJ3) TaxID=593117 RepID=C5A745_THEGJ|nr:NTPase [Thermococcus gammatolerans]ACS34057.1 ATP-binding protein, putative AAA ATPase [Thermococcus gammatolerans EJ3]